MKIKIRKWKDLTQDEKSHWLSRSELDIAKVGEDVDLIIQDVIARGDQALIDFALKFDKATLTKESLRVSDSEIKQGISKLTSEVKSALEYAIENIRAFHKIQVPKAMEWLQIRPGVWAGERATPLDSVGLYVPRGRGSFPSMLYMTAIPAQLALVPRIVLVTPPGSDGLVDPACLYAAQLCGVHEIYKIGGAGAVAALAYGTQSIKPVLKVIGPGSMYVAAAKRLLSGIIDVGLPAGPSESMILADSSADPMKVALDLMVEAEHGSDSAAFLVTEDVKLAEKVSDIILKRLEKLPEPRKTFMTDVFNGYGGIILVENLEMGIDVVNLWAPEHLSIQTEYPWDVVEKIKNAGEILLGSDLPFSAANYALGPNAVLPTGGKAKTYSPVSVRDFIKYSSIITSTPAGFSDFMKPVTILAEYEGFPSHAQALTDRPIKK